MKPFQSFSTTINEVLPPLNPETHKNSNHNNNNNNNNNSTNSKTNDTHNTKTPVNTVSASTTLPGTPNNDSSIIDHYYEEPENYLEVEVIDPKTHYDPKDPRTPLYTDYEIICRTNLPSFKKKLAKVRRRYSDFEYFRKTLIKELALSSATSKAASKIVVPHLPGKILFSNRFSMDCIENRRQDLQDWLGVVAGHPLLQSGSKVLTRFIEEDTFVG
ncbi:related to Sorting nexin-3 [Saccharomycodes ludwigii]|uniref:Sorting nexin-3 n=1 Tax=Saccharomycodes ludwigii TaxID=36035 RepID=A0A376B7E4_9ASCO|nr:hypothetical protein SCDLUD_003352 [Saccharomycodes ludwigii]KAH3900377.1 hypothetical protein SCDLUD_003352 [Saccharomycodes ludwigii]SSD60030.1 related to Sorting nexin-3 [Saccharomycodes ludwigii]